MLGLALLIGVSSGTVPCKLPPGFEARFVRDALALREGSIPRPTHVSPAEPGTFGDRAEEHLIELERSRKLITGEERNVTLSPAWKKQLAASDTSFRGLMNATHTSDAKQPPLLTLWGVFGSNEDDRYSAMTLQYASKLASLHARVDLDEGRSSEALNLCVDALALARDTGYGSMIGQMVSTVMVRSMEPVCRDAVLKARVADLTAFKNSLTRVRSAWPSFRRTFNTELIFGQLAFFFDELPFSTQAQLPASARIEVESNTSNREQMIRSAIFGRWARRDHACRLLELIEAADLPPLVAELAIERAAMHDIAPAWAGEDAKQQSPWKDFLRRWRATVARLVRLQAVAELRLYERSAGAWPESWDAARLSPPVDPRTGLPFVLHKHGNELTLSTHEDGPLTVDNLEVTLTR